ncbi:interleukin-12 subunit alpha-like [Passer montanus]|uniref:interleukin-12 subunit alpha-like n=1 Tax=Passer montanus TaxID=9160 RepID=UPI001961F743|nr:interleukin-12 subunit alpha-like [Passer montanus]
MRGSLGSLPARTIPRRCDSVEVYPRANPIPTFRESLCAEPADELRPPPAQRLNRSRELLQAANAAPLRLKESNSLGFECTLEEVDLQDITENHMNTLRACTAEEPGPGNCPTLEKSALDEGKCLQGISEDVRAYRAQLRTLPDPQLLAALDGMMEQHRAGSGGTTGITGIGIVGIGIIGIGIVGIGIIGIGIVGIIGTGIIGIIGIGIVGIGIIGIIDIIGSSGLGSLGSPGVGRAAFPERLRLCGVLQALRVRSVTICRVLSFLSSP